MSKLIDITGQRFGKLTVLKRGKSENGIAYWVCRCDCGKETSVTSQHLRNGQTKSCGCLRFGIRQENDFDLSGDYGKCTLKNGVTFIFDKEDYDKIRGYRWHIDKDGYVYTTFKGGQERLHRLILDCPKGMIIDHINRDPLDNRKENLRICTIQQNIWNRKLKGYTKVKGKYRVTLWKDGKVVFKETCDTEEKAKEVRRKAELFYFGEYAYREVVNEQNYND